MMVLRALAQRLPVSPINIHSSNEPASRQMMEALTQSNWNPTRVAPVGQEWIPRTLGSHRPKNPSPHLIRV